MSGQLPPISLNNLHEDGNILFHNESGEIARFTKDKFVVKDKKNFEPIELGQRMYDLTVNHYRNLPHTINFPLTSFTIMVGTKTVLKITAKDYQMADNWCLGAYEVEAMITYINLVQSVVQ